MTVCAWLSCSGQLIASITAADSLVYLTPIGAKNVLKQREDLKAAQAQGLAMQAYLEGLRKETTLLVGDLGTARVEIRKQEAMRKNLRKKLFWANCERWGWRVLAVVVLVKLV